MAPGGDRARRVSLFTFDGGNSLDVTGPLEVFATANEFLTRSGLAASPPYALEILAPSGGPVTLASGLRIIPDGVFGRGRHSIDTLIVCGGDARRIAAHEPTLRSLTSLAPRVRRLASVCTGAFILAAAGLLDGKRATTHWRAIGALARHFPTVAVEDDALFVRDGNTYTSAGVTAGMDLALALLEEDLGREVALQVARNLVLFLKRPGGQSQFSSHLKAQSVRPGGLADTLEWILEHLDEDLPVERLAEQAAMSPRNFARVFAKRTGLTPAKFVEQARVDAARRQLEASDASLEVVARETGFGNAERMRRTFQRHLRVVPDDYRKRFEQGALTPGRTRT